MKNITMRLSILSLFFYSAMLASAGAEIAEPTEINIVESSQDRVKMKVWCLRSFANNRDLDIHFSILNSSESDYKLIYANGIIDVTLDLTGPDGKRITGYHDRKGSTKGASYKRLFVENIFPGQEVIGDPVPLALYWPLEAIGEYRCVLTKRLYRVDPKDRQKTSTLRPGVPVDIVSPEFRFRIEAIDASYKSPAASMVSNSRKTAFDKGGIPKKNEEMKPLSPTSDSINWYIIAGLITVVLVSVIYAYFARRAKNRP